MFRSNTAKPIHKNLYNNEQSTLKNEHNILPIESLKCLEEELIKKSLISLRSPFPLWFLAETERNIFLWKNGESIIDKDNYEFLVDPNKLLEKRRKKLQTMHAIEDNPFFAGNLELQYLDEFKVQYSFLSPHIEAYVSSLYGVLDFHHQEKPLVTLPR